MNRIHKNRITATATATAAACVVVLLLSNLGVTSSQEATTSGNGNNVCRAPKPSVSLQRPLPPPPPEGGGEGGGGEGDEPSSSSSSSSSGSPLPTTREYVVGCNSWHVPILDYLTDVMGEEYEPPIAFTRLSSNMYMDADTMEESLRIGYDFMIANPYVSSCYESEGMTTTLATQVSINQDSRVPGQYYNLTQYGATLYTLRNNTAIQTPEDVKGKIIGTNKITNLATYVFTTDVLSLSLLCVRVFVFHCRVFFL